MKRIGKLNNKMVVDGPFVKNTLRKNEMILNNTSEGGSNSVDIYILFDGEWTQLGDMPVLTGAFKMSEFIFNVMNSSMSIGLPFNVEWLFGVYSPEEYRCYRCLTSMEGAGKTFLAANFNVAYAGVKISFDKNTGCESYNIWNKADEDDIVNLIKTSPSDVFDLILGSENYRIVNRDEFWNCMPLFPPSPV